MAHSGGYTDRSGYLATSNLVLGFGLGIALLQGTRSVSTLRGRAIALPRMSLKKREGVKERPDKQYISSGG